MSANISGPARLLAALCLLLSASGHIGAQEHRHHGAHVHGVAELNIVLDGTTLLVELHSPAHNLVGFEHPPRTEAQHQALTRARAALEDADRVFSLPAAAACSLIGVEAESVLFGKSHDHRNHAHHHKHDHDHDHKPGNEHQHADIHVHYEFHCTNVNALRYMDMLLFESFPGTERLRVQRIGRGGQDATTLTPERNRLPM
ncbi:hypothetical protein B1C78_15990 [Thioalkalivibrio denitrificans]|uniref:DUF2796 domain-containing protein n=1 Tax=Thioalkalivibrio denitrificans TaxID=108003 RepID=A0A1V3N9T6_9GAMM|nr:DUF2796 domain-containing protein [Thioalkalivibrio denitrificans]OOG21795.1 hypothetical protein B1C78_15990 [Thioalkalivibrio denitrificans]